MQSIMLILLVSQISYGANLGRCPMNIRIVPKEEEDEVLIKGKVHRGIFGGLTIKFTELNDNFACLVGGRGGITINRIISIGGGGYGLTNRITVNTNYLSRNYYMDFGYGGFILEFIFGSRRLIHFSVNSLIGGGSIYYKLKPDDFYWYDDVFFVTEPGFDLTINVAKNFRIDAGGSYRYIYGTNLSGISDETMGGPSVHLMFKLGKF